MSLDLFGLLGDLGDALLEIGVALGNYLFGGGRQLEDFFALLVLLGVVPEVLQKSLAQCAHSVYPFLDAAGHGVHGARDSLAHEQHVLVVLDLLQRGGLLLAGLLEGAGLGFAGFLEQGSGLFGNKCGGSFHVGVDSDLLTEAVHELLADLEARIVLDHGHKLAPVVDGLLCLGWWDRLIF